VLCRFWLAARLKDDDPSDADTIRDQRMSAASGGNQPAPAVADEEIDDLEVIDDVEIIDEDPDIRLKP